MSFAGLTSSAVVAVLVLVSHHTTDAWQNGWDGPLSMQCPNNQLIHHIESIHDNHREDRLWQYSCKSVPSGTHLSSCRWFNDVNQWDQLLAFRCHGNSVITGVRSRHDNHREDRIFSFRCCDISRRFASCYISSYINAYDQRMNYYVPPKYVLVGFVSAHHNHYEDRRWKAQICTM